MASFEIKAIGRVESALRELKSAPKQSDEGAPCAWLVFTAVDGLRLQARGLEALDGTPIIDLKPVLDSDITRR